MTLTFEEIWRKSFSDNSSSLTGDLTLDRLLSEGSTHAERARAAAGSGDWQLHYQLALELCRLSKRILFQMAKKLEIMDSDGRSQAVNNLSEAYDSIYDDASVTSHIEYGGFKNLSQIRQNIHQRIERIESWSIPEKERQNTESASPK